MPSASGVPLSTPSAAKRDSAVPSMTCTLSPNRRSISATNSAPSEASRTAAVATASRRSTSIATARRVKRDRARIASTMPSGLRRPDAASPRPSMQSAFSLKTGNGRRVGGS